MPLALYKTTKIFFAHVPKAGGTSVEAYLRQRFGGLTLIDRNKAGQRRGTGLITPATHLAAIDLVEMIPADCDLVFAIVRDPVARLQSEYRYQAGISRSSRLGFSSWLYLMLEGMRIEPRLFENHIRPQSDLVPEGAEVFRLEEDAMGQMIRRLDAVTGETRPDLEPVHRNRRPEVPLTLYRQDVELIERVFARDYDRFGLPRRPVADLPVDRLVWLRRAVAATLAPALVWRQRLRWIR